MAFAVSVEQVTYRAQKFVVPVVYTERMSFHEYFHLFLSRSHNLSGVSILLFQLALVIFYFR